MKVIQNECEKLSLWLGANAALSPASIESKSRNLSYDFNKIKLSHISKKINYNKSEVSLCSKKLLQQ